MPQRKLGHVIPLVTPGRQMHMPRVAARLQGMNLLWGLALRLARRPLPSLPREHCQHPNLGSLHYISDTMPGAHITGSKSGGDVGSLHLARNPW